MPELAVVAELGTAAGTLVLAFATFASVRSGNKAARAAERTMLEDVRPLLLPSRFDDATEKVGFADEYWVHVPGGHGSAEVGDDAIYLAMTLRNVGRGLAILNSWRLYPERLLGGDVERPDPDTFRRLNRDLYIAPQHPGFWQGAIRGHDDSQFDETAERIRNREPLTIDVLYGDGEGAQRVITRFTMDPRQDEKDQWLTAVSRHWNLDRRDPR